MYKTRYKSYELIFTSEGRFTGLLRESALFVSSVLASDVRYILVCSQLHIRR